MHTTPSHFIPPRSPEDLEQVVVRLGEEQHSAVVAKQRVEQKEHGEYDE